MILLDANLLLYAHNESIKEHAAARRWLVSVLSASESIGVAWITLIAFVRITTHSRAFPRPLKLPDAISAISDLLAFPSVTIISAGPNHWEVFRELLLAANAKGDLVTDAHLAALAIEHNATLCTNDADFSRFPGLRVEFPLRS